MLVGRVTWRSSSATIQLPLEHSLGNQIHHRVGANEVSLPRKVASYDLNLQYLRDIHCSWYDLDHFDDSSTLDVDQLSFVVKPMEGLNGVVVLSPIHRTVRFETNRADSIAIF
jgi:hypothetical protein